MKVRYQKLGSGVLGVLSVPTTTPGVVTTSAYGENKAEALARAAAIAARIADDPVMAVIMPASTLDNLDALRDLAEAAQEGPDALREAWRDIAPGHRKLAKALHGEACKREREPWNDTPGARYSDVDVVNGHPSNPQVAGFWDDVKSVASTVGNEAWKQAKAHQKEIAMAAATAALGPAGGIAAGKAMDLVTAAQAGSAPAKQAIAQVATKANAGDPKARTMLRVITRVVKHDAEVARDHRVVVEAPAAQPDDDGADNGEQADELHDDADNGQGDDGQGDDGQDAITPGGVTARMH